jgi:hypothetical protein
LWNCCSSWCGSWKPMCQHKCTPGLSHYCGLQKNQFSYQCQEPTFTHTSETQALFCWCQNFSLSTVQGGPVFSIKPSWGRVPVASSKSRNPATPLSANCPSVDIRRPTSLKCKKAQGFPQFPALAEPLLLH